jgi:hypothetical protein
VNHRELDHGLWRRRAWRRLLAALLTAGACAAPASAAVVVQTEHSVPGARGLSAAERQAITIATVNLTGDDSLGAFVGVTFRGDVEHYLGQGDLSSGLLALALVPAGGGQPAGLVDEGGGRSERVLRFTSARPAGVIRHGNQVPFTSPASASASSRGSS